MKVYELYCFNFVSQNVSNNCNIYFFTELVKVYDGDASYLKHTSFTVKVPKAVKTETLISTILQSLNISQSAGNLVMNLINIIRKFVLLKLYQPILIKNHNKFVISILRF